MSLVRLLGKVHYTLGVRAMIKYGIDQEEFVKEASEVNTKQYKENLDGEARETRKESRKKSDKKSGKSLSKDH